jgi:hypothetical protein
MGMLSSSRDWETGKDRGNNEYSQIQIPDENLLQSSNNFRLVGRFTFQQYNDPKQHWNGIRSRM